MGYLTAAAKTGMLNYMLNQALGSDALIASFGNSMHATNGAMNVPGPTDQGYGDDVLTGGFSADHPYTGSWTCSTTGTGAGAVVTATNSVEVSFGTASRQITCDCIVLSDLPAQGSPDDGICLAIIDIVDAGSGSSVSRTFEIGDQVRFPAGALRVTM